MQYNLDGMGIPEDERLFSLEGGCSFDCHKTVPHLFLVGTEEGHIHKCSKDYNSQYLMSYEGHQMAVYNIRYSPFLGNVFLSASADWTVKLWDHDRAQPLMSFDLSSSVGDIAWAPYSSTVFAAATADGRVGGGDARVALASPTSPASTLSMSLGTQGLIRPLLLHHAPFDPSRNHPPARLRCSCTT